MSVDFTLLKELLVTRLRVPAELIGPDVTFEDLELDSLALVEFLTVVEDELGLCVAEEDVAAHFTVAQAVEALADKAVRS
ncbi:acyl carrier protein [Streptomyces sp. NPDC055239]